VSTTPEALFRRFLESGDERALDGLFRRCGPTLRQFAASLGLEPGTAEDLVQETLVTAVQRATAFDPSRTLLPWLKGILARKAARHARDAARRNRRAGEAAAVVGPMTTEPADALAEAELRRAVAHALADLPDRYAAPLRLHLLEGHSPREVAEELGIPRATVRVQLHRGLEMLRRVLPAGFGLALTLKLRAGTSGAFGRRGWWKALRPALATALLAGAAALCLLPTVPGLTGHEDLAAPRGQYAAAHESNEPDAEPERVPRHAASRIEVALPPASILIRVVDPAGSPVPGVGVWCEPLGVDPIAHHDHRCSNSLGEVRFSAPRSAFVVRTDRGASVRVPPGHRDPIELAVPPGRTVTGRVLTDLGTPVARASIWLGRAGDGAWVGGVVAETGADGSFVLHHVQPGATLAARADGHGRSAPVAVHQDAVDIMLRPPGGAIRGVVRDAQGRPLPDLPVSLGRSLAHALDRLADGAAVCPAPPVLVRTDANGSFGPVAMEAGEHPVFVRAVGFAPGAAHAVVGHRSLDRVELVLQPSCLLEGVVLHPDGRPAAFVDVSYRSAHRHHVVDLVTSDDGSFSVESPPGTDGVLAVRADGCEPLMHRVSAGQRLARLELARAWRFELAVELPRDCDRAEVRVRYPARSQLESGEVVFATCGGLTAVPVPSDRPLTFAIRLGADPIWHPARIAAGSPRDDPPRLVVCDELRPSSCLTGRCLDADDVPVTGARVFVGQPDGVMWEAGHTDDRGRFRLGPLVPASEYRLFVEATRDRQPSFFGGVTDLRADEVRRVRLTPPPTGTVRFALLDDGGETVRDAVVTVVGGGRRFALRSEGAGEVVLPPGEYELYAMGERFAWIHGFPFRVTAGETRDVQCRVEAAARRVLALSGLPPGAVDVELRRLGDGQVMAEYTLLQDSLPRLTAFLPVGSYETVVRRGGDVLAGTFAIGDLGLRLAPVSVHLALRDR